MTEKEKKENVSCLEQLQRILDKEIDDLCGASRAGRITYEELDCTCRSVWHLADAKLKLLKYEELLHELVKKGVNL